MKQTNSNITAMIFIMEKVGSRKRFVQYFQKECQSYYRLPDVHKTGHQAIFYIMWKPPIFSVFAFSSSLRLRVFAFSSSLRLCAFALSSSLRLCTPCDLALGIQSPPFTACARYTVFDRQAGKVVPEKGESGFFEILFNSGNSCRMMNPWSGKCKILAGENIDI
jgi:hypothetical protein